VSAPTWAVLQRELFDLLDRAWRRFAEVFCDDGGALRFEGPMSSRDGGDDFYEAFSNWPQLYLLGGSSELLDASIVHWEAVTRQLTDLGMLRDEFDKGYDWFHLGEGLLPFYQLCMASPARFADRARRFADLYVDPAFGNYDPELAMIRAPHNGALGARFGVNDGGRPYPWSDALAAQYGYPLDWMPGAAAVRDDPRLGEWMHERLGRGDVAINLGAVALVANAQLVAPDQRYVDWCRQYVGAWRSRAIANGGLIPDNVGPDGKVGSLLDGRWYGGHYGWAWPHGCYSVGTAVLVGTLAAALVTGDPSVLDVPRSLLDTVIAQGKTAPISDSSLLAHWRANLGDDVDNPTFLVPYRHSDRGWFDFNPMQAALPTALWHETGAADDRARLAKLRSLAGYDWATVRSFRDKEEAGHEEPWLAYLSGDNNAYPEQILRVALEQARRRMTLLDQVTDPVGREADIHRWQRLNPIVTEALVQLTWGAPQTLYNGGLTQARVRYFDADAQRPGLPPGVAALVRSIEPAHTIVELVNLDDTPRRLVVQAGAFAQDVIESTGSPWLELEVPPGDRLLTLTIHRNVRTPAYATPWEAA
jgi:hypothetical protein